MRGSRLIADLNRLRGDAEADDRGIRVGGDDNATANAVTGRLGAENAGVVVDHAGAVVVPRLNGLSSLRP